MFELRHAQQLDRMERKIDHLHDMEHAIVEAINALMVSQNDQFRLAAAAGLLKSKTDALRAAIASVDSPPPTGVK